ncbi:MAG: hypothetical protein K8S87_00565 [Planctomycetes bacterium]|nr:hypothetical protein [Planctomycetota bacterium]
MRRFLFLVLLANLLLLGCSAISNINEVGKSKILISQFIDYSGGTIEYRKHDSHSNGVSIVVQSGTVFEKVNFGIYYFESFPKKPFGMMPESIAFEIKFESELNKRVKIIIPFISDVAIHKGLALFTYNKNDRKWHFAGGCALNQNAKTVSAMIDSPGIFAVMRHEDDMPSEILTDFEVGFDTFNAPADFTTAYCNASTSYAFWFYNYKKYSLQNLYSKYSSKESLLVTRAASAEFDKTQFTSALELSENAEFTDNNAPMYIKTALAFENRPIIAVLDREHTIIINKYQNYDFYCYDPYKGNREQTLSYDPVIGNFKYDGNIIAKIAFFGMLETCNEGFNTIYNYFENVTSLEISEVVGTLGDTLQASSGSFVNFEFNITQYAVTNDIRIQVYEIYNLPNPPANATWQKPLFRLLGPIDSMFDRPVEITIHYTDVDNDGIIDGTNLSENEIYVAAYNFEAESWATTEIIRSDSFFNTLTVSSYYASDFGLFGIEPLTVSPRAEFAATTVFKEWPLGQNESTLIDNTCMYNLNSLHVSAFECIGPRQFNVRFNKESNMIFKSGFSWSDPWYSHTNLINKSYLQNVDLYFIVSCFTLQNGVSVDDVDNPDSHAYYIVNTLLSFILEHLQGAKGIILKDIALESGTHTQFEVELLTKFITRVREKLGKKTNSGLELVLEVEPLIGNDCGNLFGQRYTDFSKYADILLLKTFDEYLQPFDLVKTKQHLIPTLIACTSDNVCTVQVQVSTKAQANSDTVFEQLNVAMKYYATGFTIIDYPSTSQTEWGSIVKFTPQN